MKSKDIQHGIEYAAARGALTIAGRLPLGIARAIGASIGTLAFALRIRRKVCISNITAAMGVSQAEAARIMRQSYQNLGRALMEFSAFKRWSREDLLDQVVIEGAEHLEAVRAAGCGAVAVGGHLGCWELAGITIAALGYPTNFLVGEQSNRRIDDVMNELRLAQGVIIVPRAFSLRKALTALRANEFVVLLADQDARKGGVIVDFLGRPASAVRGPALFAIRARSAIIPFSSHREGRRHRVIFEAPLWPDPALDEESAVVDLTHRNADALAKRIRAHPEEYFWPHRRWKTGVAQTSKTHAVRAPS